MDGNAPPSLVDICSRIVTRCYDYLGNVPYHLIEDNLAMLTPEQLLKYEARNPYLIDYTDDLWKKHCAGHFPEVRSALAQDNWDSDEAWRIVYQEKRGEKQKQNALVADRLRKAYGKAQEKREKKKIVVVDKAVVGLPRRKFGAEAMYAAAAAENNRRTAGRTLLHKSKLEARKHNSKFEAAAAVVPMIRARPPPASGSVSSSPASPAPLHKRPRVLEEDVDRNIRRIRNSAIPPPRPASSKSSSAQSVSLDKASLDLSSSALNLGG
ncbi:hypothetical protein RI367_004993 [Sorochytrium milnesiophthora]